MAAAVEEGVVKFRSVSDHIIALDIKTVEKLYGKDSIYDPALHQGYQGSFSSGRSASRAVTTSSTPTQPVDKKDYAVPWTCKAVVRSMSPLAQLLCMRFLYLDGPVPIASVRAWIHEQGQKKDLEQVIKELIELKVVNVSGNSMIVGNAKKRQRVSINDDDNIAMNIYFQSGMRQGLLSDASMPWRTIALKADKRGPSIETIDKNMHDKWDKVLNYLVMPSSAYEVEVGPVVERFFKRAGLIVEAQDEDEEDDDDDEKGPSFKIGSKGYEFLLQNIHVQIWRFAEELMVQDASRRSKSYPKEVVLRFLFQLGFCQVGQDYAVNALDEEEKVLLEHFSEFGIVYWGLRENGTRSSRFYPSSVACHLVDGFTTAGVSRIANLSHFHTIVQSNFQVVAYTVNVLHLRMLGLFCQLRSILPNAVIAVISRKSFMDALEDGISSDQILSFLMTNAHPRAQERKEVVPQTIIDQLRLWEKERNRISYQKGVYYSFEASVRFEVMTQQLERHGLLLWKDSKHKKLVALPDPLTDEIIENS